MKDVLAGMIVGLLLLMIWTPERVGSNAHETYKGLVAGWDSVK